MFKALKEIRRLASTAACDMSDVLEYGDAGRTEEEAEVLEFIQVRLQAILRNVDEALERIERRLGPQQLGLLEVNGEG